MSKIEQQILNTALYNINHPPRPIGGTSSKFTEFYKAINKHFSGRLSPYLQELGETLVYYWPAFFLWGEKKEYKRGAFDSQTYLYKSGTYGTGYLALANSLLFITVISDASKKFPMFPEGATGFVFTVLSGMAGERDDRKRYTGTKIWEILYSDILGVQIVTNEDQRDVIALHTVPMNYQIEHHFRGSLQYMLAGIRMGMKGRLKNLGTNTTPNDQPSQDAIELLKKLNDLKLAGIISEEEFQQKKKAILAQV